MTALVDPKAVVQRLQAGAIKPAGMSTAPEKVQIDPKTKAVIDQLFVQLKGIFSGWRSPWPDGNHEGAAKREWVVAMMEEGVSDIACLCFGLRLARKVSSDNVFPPSPGQFIDWCLSPEAFGLPDAEKALNHALRNTHPVQVATARWSHDAIYHAAVACGFSTLQSLDRKAALLLFRKHYKEVCRRLWRGEALPVAPVAALPAPAKRGDLGVGRAALAALRSKVGAHV